MDGQPGPEEAKDLHTMETATTRAAAPAASPALRPTTVRSTRLIAALQGASGFIEQLPAKFRVGIVTFASTTQTLTSPTTDRRTIYQAIASLHAEGATAMDDGIERVLNVKRPPATVTTLPGARAAPMAPQAPTGKQPPLEFLRSEPTVP